MLGYLWQALAEDGASQAREWEFVEKHFGSFDLETQHRLLSLLRSLPAMGAALKIDALDHLKAQDVAPHPTNLAVALDLIARARNQAVQQFQGDFDQVGVWLAPATEPRRF